MTGNHRYYAAHQKFLLTCLLRGMTIKERDASAFVDISTHMPLARHDIRDVDAKNFISISTHMPLARHDVCG